MLSYRSGKSAVICKDGFYGPSEREISEVKQHTKSCPLTYITFLKSKASLPGIDFSKKYTLEYLVTLKRRVLISNWYVNYIFAKTQIIKYLWQMLLFSIHVINSSYAYSQNIA